MEISERYSIEAKLGQQHKRKFGSVYRVRNKATEAHAVLKAISKSEGSEHLVERLKHEASFDFDIDGLPSVIEMHESDSELLVVKKIVEGTSLQETWDVLHRKNRIEFLIDFLKQLNRLMEHLEQRKIVHCDLKPSNILIDLNNKVHLIDFGLALRQEDLNERRVLFPLGYAAPELVLNRLHLVDKRTDYFSLGILIWRLFAGKLPLTHPNPSIFTNLQLTHPLPEHPEIRTTLYKLLARLSSKHQFDVPPNRLAQEQLDAQLLQGMDKRYTDLSLFIEDLEQLTSRKRFKIRGLFGSRG